MSILTVKIILHIRKWIYFVFIYFIVTSLKKSNYIFIYLNFVNSTINQHYQITDYYRALYVTGFRRK